MKRKYFLLLLLCVCLGMNAQSQNRNVTGVVLDSETKEGIELASVRLLNSKDSTYVSGVMTDEYGKFSIGAKSGTYIVHVSFIGYLDQYISVNTREKTALGDILMKIDGIMLSASVIEAKAPEIIVKGDTVEYNADSYKVQETAVLADLIKKIPGAEIDSEGKITINGKDISKILVDGKEFFSNDPKIASENLPAKMIERLQVLDKKSDMAQFTGFDDGEEQTVINLIARPGMKEGVMGKLSGGYGSKDRYEADGFLNIARNDNRLSALGNFNNNNNANAGMGGPRRGGNRGVTETTMGGVNLAIETSDKFKFDGDIQYNERDNVVETTTSTQYLDQDMSSQSSRTQNSVNKNFNTRFKFEWTPDSLTNIIFRPNVSYNKSNSLTLSDNERLNNSQVSDNFRSKGNSVSEGSSFGFDGNLLVNRKLNNEGRTLTFEFSGGLSDGDNEGLDYFENDYYNIDSLSIQNQKYNQKDKSYNWRARVSYTEPIGRGNLLELAYDLRNTHSETDKVTYNFNETSKDYTDLAEDYTRKTQNDFLNQIISLNFKSSREKYNYTLGAGLEPSRSQTTVVQPNLSENKDKARNFLNFAPKVEFNYLWDKRHNLRFRYDGRTRQASTTQLFDGIISQNATDTTWGNPNLKPSFEHRMNLRYQKYMPEKASTIMAFANFTYLMNDIVSIEKIGDGNSRNTRYENMDGNMTGRAMFMYNTPLKNKSFSINTHTFLDYTRDNTLLYPDKSEESTKNTANVYRVSERLRLKFTSDKFEFNIGGAISYEDARNSFSKRNDKAIYDFEGFGDFIWYLPYNFVLASDLNYSSNSGYEDGYQQNSWIWNAELAKDFNIKLKSESLPATLKFKMYDILQDRSNISRSATARNITYSTYNTISSYFMVGLTIRFQSFKGGAKSSDMEMQGPGMRGPGGPPVGGGGRRGGGGPMAF